jgi:hypothetical protein
VRQLGHLVLARVRLDRFREARIPNERVGGDLHLARRRDQARTDIAERVGIARDRQRRREAKVIGLDDVERPRRVDVEHQHHRRAPHELVEHLETNANLHELDLGLRQG